MFTKAVAAFVGAPLLLTGLLSLDISSVAQLRGTSGVFDAPQQVVVGFASGSDGAFTESLDAGTEPFETASVPTTSTAAPTPCPPCLCGPGATPSPDLSRLSFGARILVRATTTGDDELSRLVWAFGVLYGAAAATCGWAWRGCLTDRAGRSGSMATEGVRPRGAGYRAGLEAPRGLR